jgi:hypothetical protein
MDQHNQQEHAVQLLPRNRGQSALQALRNAGADDDTALLGPARIPESEEMLIIDGRANLGPAQLVENKLSNLLRSSLLPVSHVRLTALCGGRRSG